MVNEIVLAIDPALCRIEEILLWKNKLKTAAVFTLCNFFFWFFQNFNIRTFCTLSCIGIVLHLLDGYRAKKQRELNRLQQLHKQQNTTPKQSQLGVYIVWTYRKAADALALLAKIKAKNRVQYFMLLLVLWSVAAVVGTNIRGVYLSYMLFWVVFFVPTVVHYDVPKRLLRKALPLLEQLDQSMRYERRSLLDRAELLVDVRLPSSEADSADQAQEDEYMQSFKLADDLHHLHAKQRRTIENLVDDEDDDDEEEEEDDESTGEERDRHHADDDEIGEHEIPRASANSLMLNLDDDDEDVVENIVEEIEYKISASSTQNSHRHYNEPLTTNANAQSLDHMNSTDDADDSFMLGDKVLRQRRVRHRPSLLDYYGEELTTAAAAPAAAAALPKKGSLSSVSGAAAAVAAGFGLFSKNNEHDIDETFDFLDEELNKY